MPKYAVTFREEIVEYLTTEIEAESAEAAEEAAEQLIDQYDGFGPDWLVVKSKVDSWHYETEEIK